MQHPSILLFPYFNIFDAVRIAYNRPFTVLQQSITLPGDRGLPCVSLDLVVHSDVKKITCVSFK